MRKVLGRAVGRGGRTGPRSETDGQEQGVADGGDAAASRANEVSHLLAAARPGSLASQPFPSLIQCPALIIAHIFLSSGPRGFLTQKVLR